MNTPPELTVGVAGLGVGEQHAITFSKDPRCRLAWLCDISQEKIDDVSHRVTASRTTTSLNDLIADEGLRAVSLATLDHQHYAQVLSALEQGKHVFVEKPLCRTSAEVTALHSAWLAAGKPHLASNLVLRAAELYTWLKRSIAAGEFGEIYAFDGDYLYGRVHKITEGWRRDVPDYSVMEGGGVHLIDLMVMLLGERPDSAETVGTNRATRDTAFPYDDFMTTTFRFASGIVGRITANFACVHPHHHVIRIFGTKATFLYDDQGPRLFTSRAEDTPAEKLDLAPLPDHKGVLIPDFVSAIASGRDATDTALREFNLIKICAAADQSHAEDRRIEIEYLT